MAYTETQMQQIIAEYGPTVYRLAMAQLRRREEERRKKAAKKTEN